MWKHLALLLWKELAAGVRRLNGIVPCVQWLVHSLLDQHHAHAGEGDHPELADPGPTFQGAESQDPGHLGHQGDSQTQKYILVGIFTRLLYSSTSQNDLYFTAPSTLQPIYFWQIIFLFISQYFSPL